jgi:hypothetical protein
MNQHKKLMIDFFINSPLNVFIFYGVVRANVLASSLSISSIFPVPFVRAGKTDPAQARANRTPVITAGVKGIAVKRHSALKCADGEIWL